ncbi:MAG: hypothetical protein ACRC1K_21635 [Planctomycetia bacterium]
MGVSPEALEAKIDAGNAALARGDYAAALAAFMAAKAILCGLPNGAQGATSVQWSPAAIDSLIADVRRLQTSRVGIQTTRIRYVRRGDE